MIEVSEVTKRFAERVAVDHVSFSVRKGEVMGFLGPNGAGKTTTMRIITGFMPPSEGHVEVNGLDVFEHPFEVKKTIGYMPEHPPLYLDMTVEGYLSFAAELRGLRGKAVARAVEQAAARCGLIEVIRRLTGNLSKGYRQRVGLAQALVHDPEVLVLDEPTVGLDPRQILEIRELIRELGREKTVILSTHILPEVTMVCGSISIIHQGRLVASDSIENLQRRFSGGAMVTALVKRPDRLDVASLRAIEGVVGVENKGGGVVEVALLERTDVLLEKISGALQESGAGLLEFRPSGLTLEEVFMKAVAGDVGVSI